MLHLKKERERGRKVRWERAGERERGGGRVEWGRREKGERERSRRSVVCPSDVGVNLLYSALVVLLSYRVSFSLV